MMYLWITLALWLVVLPALVFMLGLLRVGKEDSSSPDTTVPPRGSPTVTTRGHLTLVKDPCTRKPTSSPTQPDGELG
jgi:hypothetical protein